MLCAAALNFNEAARSAERENASLLPQVRPVWGSRTEIRPIIRRTEIVPCGIYGSDKIGRDLTTEQINSTDIEYDKPILSDSMAVHPSQVAEHRGLIPTSP